MMYTGSMTPNDVNALIGCETPKTRTQESNGENESRNKTLREFGERERDRERDRERERTDRDLY